MRNELKAVMAKLQQIQNKVENFLLTAQDVDCQNDKRIEKLENELNAIDEIIDILENIE